MAIGTYVPGYGNANARLMCIGEAPGRHEGEASPPRPFVGPSGEEHTRLLFAAGLRRHEVYDTNVFKYVCPGSKIENFAATGHTIDEGLPDLWDEIDAIRPNCILLVGAKALEYVAGRSGIMKWRGSIIQVIVKGRVYKAVPTIHPSAYLHYNEGRKEGGVSYKAKAYVQLDYIKAAEEAKTGELLLPSPILQLARGPYELYEFLQRYRPRRRVMVDLEVIKCVPVCIALAFSRHHGISVPLLPMDWVKGHIKISHGECKEILKMLVDLLEDPEIQVMGQNFKFDRQKLEHPMGIRVANVTDDTMLMEHVLNPEFPKALEFISSIYTRVPYYKEEGRQFNVKKDNFEDFMKYNARDSTTQFECWEEMMKELIELGLLDFYQNVIMPQHNLYYDMEEVGFLVDKDERLRLWDKYTDWQIRLQTELNELAGFQCNANSNTKDVPLFLFQHLKLPKREDVKEDTLVSMLGNAAKTAPQKRGIELVLTLRRIKLTKSKIAARLDYDGRMRTGWRICGAETGRGSTAILKAPVRPHPMGMAFHSITKHGDIGSDIRRMLVADPGFGIMNVDLSQAEARIVALLAEDYELLKLFDTPGFDVHAMTAQWIFGGKLESHFKIKGVEPPSRFTGKTVRHAGDYDMQKHRCMLEVNSNARRGHVGCTHVDSVCNGSYFSISEWKAGEILRIFHNRSPKIKGTFHAEIQKVAMQDRTLRNPYGRVRRFFERLGEDLFKEMYAHIPQSTVKDHLTLAMLRVKKRIPEIRYVLEAHDAACCLYPLGQERRYAEAFTEELTKPIDFAQCTLPRGCLVIPCEVEIGSNYKDLQRYKL